MRRPGLRGDPATFVEGYRRAVKTKDLLFGLMSGMSQFFLPDIPRFALTQGGRMQALDDL